MSAAGITISTFSFVFICFMAFLAGFVDASAGGGGIITIPAYLFIGLPPHIALGTNKLSSCCGTLFAVISFWRGKAVNMRSALYAAAGSFVGSALGARTALMLDSGTLRTMLFILLPCAAAVIFFNRRLGESESTVALSSLKFALLSFTIGLLIGGYDGLVGPGTGTFAIIAFSLLMHFDLRTASGNAKILNLVSNVTSVVTFAAAGTIAYSIALPAGLCGIAGNCLGAHCALKGGARFIRPMLLVVLALLMIKLLTEALR